MSYHSPTSNVITVHQQSCDLDTDLHGNDVKIENLELFGMNNYQLVLLNLYNLQLLFINYS